MITARPSALLVLLGLAACASPPATSLWEHPWRMGPMPAVRLGPPFALGRVTPLEEITASPQAFVGRPVRTRGRIASTCNDAGCWIDLWPDAPGGEGIFITAWQKRFSNPLDCVGRHAEVEGRFEVRAVAPDRLRHWSHHGWRPGLRVRGPMQVLRIDATTVEIR